MRGSRVCAGRRADGSSRLVKCPCSVQKTRSLKGRARRTWGPCHSDNVAAVRACSVVRERGLCRNETGMTVGRGFCPRRVKAVCDATYEDGSIPICGIGQGGGLPSR